MIANETQFNIINAARELIYKNGYVETNMNDVRKRANVSKEELEKYFTSKKEIVLAVIDQVTDFWNKHLVQDILAKSLAKPAINAMFDWIMDLNSKSDEQFSYSISNILYELYNVDKDFAGKIDAFTNSWSSALAVKIAKLHPGIGTAKSELQAKNPVKLLQSTMIMTKMTGQIAPVKSAITEIKLKINL